MGFADMDLHTVAEVQGLPDYLIQTGQQVSRIVTTDQGQMFFHSGSSNGATEIGIYTSWDGINWSLFNDGITGANDGLSQGSLAVDGNKVFMATHDGQVWMYHDTVGVSSTEEYGLETLGVQLYPNPGSDHISIHFNKMKSDENLQVEIYSLTGQLELKQQFEDGDHLDIDVSRLTSGIYQMNVLRSGDWLKSVRWVKI